MRKNTPFDEIALGQSITVSRSLTAREIEAIASLCGIRNLAQLQDHLASGTPHPHTAAVLETWTVSLITTLLNTEFPGSGTRVVRQNLQFVQPTRPVDTVQVQLTVTACDPAEHAIMLDCRVITPQGETLLAGRAGVVPPTHSQKVDEDSRPEAHLFDPDAHLRDLLALGDGLAAVRCGVVHPCDEGSLTGAIAAARAGLIEPVLIGPEVRLRALATQLGLSIAAFDVVNVQHSHEAAQRAAELAASGELESLMKGSLHTDELMQAVLAQRGLRTKRRLSHVFRFELPRYEKPLLITDAALNIRPTLEDKRDIVQNAIDLSTIMGRAHPKVAILSAVETINSDIPSTLDASALCKMADRGQITGALLDGPLAFDNAISPEAVRIKNIRSEVAGDADILLVPDLESGNMLAKQLEYFGGASSCGVVLGARIPIALTSRADGVAARMASALLVKLIAHHYRAHRP